MKKTYIYLTIVLALLLLTTSLYGLLSPLAYAKETSNWTAQVIAQDWVDLIIATPLLLVSASLAYKKLLGGYFAWLGTLVFLIYSFMIYAFDAHLNDMFIMYVAVLGLSTYLLIFSLVNCDFDQIKKRFDAKWKGKSLSSFLIVVAILFALLWLKDIVGFMVTGVTPQSLIDAGTMTNPVHVLDLAFFLPAMILAAILLKRKSRFGYVLPFIVLVNTTLIGCTIMAISIVYSTRGLGNQLALLVGFGIVTLVSMSLFITGLRKLKTPFLA